MFRSLLSYLCFGFLLLPALLLSGCTENQTSEQDSSEQAASQAAESPISSSPLSEEAKAAVTELVVSGQPSVLYIYADWCPVCRKFKPVLSEVMAKSYPDIALVKVEVDQNSELPKKLKINSIPTLLLFDAQGQYVELITGALEEADLKGELDKINN